MMKLIGSQGGQGFLIMTEGNLEDGKARGFAWNRPANKTSPTMYILAIAKFGYWQDTTFQDQPPDIQQILKERFPEIE
jgi:hypothetical protein